jgi:hypothetical protein
MDKIQKVLIEQGRKDLAQQYYLKTVESSLKGLDKKIIRDLLSKKIGEDSEWIPAKLTRKVDSGVYGIFEKGKDFPLYIIKTDYSNQFEIRDPKTGGLLSGNKGLNLKGIRAWFESKNIELDLLDVKTPSQIEMKQKPSWGEGEKNYKGEYNIYDASGKSSWVTKAEFDRIMREREMNKPLKDIRLLKKDVFKDRFMKSIPKLESLVSTITGYDLKAKISGTVTNSKYFSIEFTPSFFGKDLGVFKFALSDASFSIHCNPTPEKEKIWFPLHLNWNHIKGGSNGGTTYNLGGKSINLWYVQATGEWEEDRS